MRLLKDVVLFRTSNFSLGKRGIIYFGKNRTERFDDPQGKYGVCYLGVDAYACFIETFGQSRGINIVDRQQLTQRVIAEISLSGQLKLIDLTGAGLAMIGAAGEITAGHHELSQQWSRALFEHPEKADGIYYRARHDPERFCLALFSRHRAKLTVASSTPWSDASLAILLSEILDHYNFGLV